MTSAHHFWSKVKIKESDDCWVWQAGTKGMGYGQYHIEGHPYYAHRVAYELSNGPFDKSLSVLHTCDNPPCCNPKHLFLGTDPDNNRDKMLKGRGLVKVTLSDITEMMELHKHHIYNYAELGRIYGLTKASVRQHILRRLNCDPTTSTAEPSTTSSSTAASTQLKPIPPTIN